MRLPPVGLMVFPLAAVPTFAADVCGTRAGGVDPPNANTATLCLLLKQ